MVAFAAAAANGTNTDDVKSDSGSLAKTFASNDSDTLHKVRAVIAIYGKTAETLTDITKDVAGQENENPRSRRLPEC